MHPRLTPRAFRHPVSKETIRRDLLLSAAGMGVDQRQNAEVVRPQAKRLERRGEPVGSTLPVPGEQEARSAGQGLGRGDIEAHSRIILRRSDHLWYK